MKVRMLPLPCFQKLNSLGLETFFGEAIPIVESILLLRENAVDTLYPTITALLETKPGFGNLSGNLIAASNSKVKTPAGSYAQWIRVARRNLRAKPTQIQVASYLSMLVANQSNQLRNLNYGNRHQREKDSQNVHRRLQLSQSENCGERRDKNNDSYHRQRC